MIKRSRKRKDGTCPIYLRITIDGKRTEISTKKTIKENQWDDKFRKIRGNTEQIRQDNLYLQSLLTKADKLQTTMALQSKIPTPREIKDIIFGVEERENQQTIMKAFDYHNLKMAEEVKVGKIVPKTHQRYLITKNKVQAFMQSAYRKDDMPLEKMRLRFVTEFEHYLLTKDRLQSNTAHKYIRNLKKIMNMSVALDWIPSNPFNNFRCTYTHPKREVLTQEEIDAIIEKDFHSERLNQVADVFIFCCYTGFAYSDVYKLTQDDVVIGMDGNPWITTYRKKTDTQESVPLLPIALKIVEKYRKNEECVKQNKLLPVNSNQRYNSYLKEIAAICGIEKKLTTHIARHTFATTITLANGVPIETVSKMLGHQSIRTTQIYAKVVQRKVSEDMMKLKGKLFAPESSKDTKAM